MHDSDRFVEEIVHGVEMIVEFDLRSVIAGTRSIARAVHHLPTYLDECENTEADLKTLESWAHIFIEPVNLVQTIAGNALHNLSKVSVDVLKARRDLKEQKFFAFGDEVGKLLAFLTTPLSEEELQALINQE